MLLTTKLFIPIAGEPLVPRPRLLTKLDSGLTRRLTLVSAMAGYGKTTLVADWLQQRLAAINNPPPFAATWLSLDERDNDPARFLRYLVAAYQRIDPQIGSALMTQLQTPPLPAWETLMTQLLNDLAESAPRKLLVLDDYHLIDNPVIHDAIALLIEHLVMTTRADPPLPLARWRARRQLLEVRADELRFSREETAHFMERLWPGAFSADNLVAIEEQMEGWAAGLQLAAVSLAAVSLAERADVAAFLRSFTGSHSHIMDFLVEEVLERQPSHVQRFLLYTSLLDRFCAPLCDTLIALDDGAATQSAQSLLDYLTRNNLFLYALDEAQQWRRYHHLFADALRNRLQQTQPALLPALHEQAGRWFAEQGLLNEAIPHLLAAGDSEGAGCLIEREAEPLLRQGQHTTLQGWLEQLPATLVQAQPGLALVQARTLLVVNQLDAAEAHLRIAAASAVTNEHQGTMAAVAAGIALNRGDYGQAVELAQAALAQLPTASPLHSETLLHLGLAYSNRGDPASAERSYAEAVVASKRLGDQRTAVVALFNQGALLHSRGELRRAAAQYEEVIRYARSAGVAKMPQSAYAQLLLGDLWLEWNDLPKSAQLLEEARARLAQDGLMRMLTVAYVYLARLAWARQQRETAQHLLELAFQLVERHALPLRYAGPVWAFQARLWLAIGNLPAASGWAATCGLTADDATFALIHEERYVALAYVLHRQGQSADAARLIGRYRAQMAQEGRDNSVIVLAPLHAVLLDATGDRVQALKTLTSVLPQAATEGYVRAFLEVGASLTPLLTILCNRRQAPTVATLLRRLLDALALPAHNGAPATAMAHHHTHLDAPLEPLSERELEVLRAVAAGLSDRQVAEQLYLAVGTVKKHLNNLYGKLGVNSRTAALAQARAFHLL